MKKVLIACEESQIVCKAFRARGFEAYSCDIQPPSGGHPEWHILGDAVENLRGGDILTMDMQWHDIGRWDLAICHPPCTDLAISGARWFPEKQKDFRQQKAVAFFMQMFAANADSIAVENPVGIMSRCFRKPDQIIQPYQYGHEVMKTTCLWLVNLPKLIPTNIVKPKQVRGGDGKNYSGAAWNVKDENGKVIPWNDPRTAKERSKTYEGIAVAMAEQWGNYIMESEEDNGTDTQE